MSASELAVEIIHPNDVSTQLDSSDSARLINQDQPLLKSLHGNILHCLCSEPLIAMHIKHGHGRYWLSDNPGSPEHDVECPLYSHKLKPNDKADPYRLRNAIDFNVVERNQNTSETQHPPKTAANTQKTALKPLIERVFRYLYENSFASYCFGGTHDVAAITQRMKKSQAAKELSIGNQQAKDVLFYGMKGLAMLKSKLRSGEIESGLWMHSFSRYENKSEGFFLDNEFYPSLTDLKNPKRRGPFLALMAWTGKDSPICKSVFVTPVASKQLALPVVDIEHRETLLISGAFIDSNRNNDNKLYLFQPFPVTGSETIEGEIIFGKRERRILYTINEGDLK